MDIDRDESVKNPYEEYSELELLRDEYTEFLLDLYTQIQGRCKEHSFLWFDRCTFPEFMEMALEISTGPPTCTYA